MIGVARRIVCDQDLVAIWLQGVAIGHAFVLRHGQPRATFVAGKLPAMFDLSFV